MMTGKRLVISALVLALVQLGFLSWIIASRAAILRNGKEVLLKIQPVDPRDLLRGDYIVLGYDISRIPVKMIANIASDKQSSDDTSIVVRLKKGADGYWTPTAAWFGTAPTPAAADEADISGHVAAGWDLRGEGMTIAPDYGIERFYLPEGEGMAIQSDMRVRPFGIKLALAADGTAQIKALMDGDKTLFEEPLY
ncbi:GDYXXLXY domain-containing protein [Mesorhizobium sp. CO1-1-7]|uniref:GDYXXLXY domain-containing protein n=1 Tax=unclassified Mesorhizobium TaxID=325217 RepID=UPI00112C8F43|nr:MULTISPECIES: GDYXXLXY domain-containing protein [unclassified Mesorhizobium]MBZ9693553.1 GDYXXLXY domain-containing protein [Mesorhizobium sp. CO1-1-9]MBZ9745199.1 GDYXXLXY domain-containing protein [Mesorhizobium sp. CO1-1-7]TPJ12896.1 GDYXXLXY domain-containing protein [Mesorhizobium sp. B2-7-3]TPK16555.1 GDYXXLXY domain-containing protein [Mesorhizobium sp. B2-5-9]TPK17399.1 GDYXXLXY domain-containing protein [Mesorhizobium sp. B2-5-7]